MKLSAKQTATLIEVLNAQSGVSKIEDKDVYKAKLAEVADLLETKDGKISGGITAEVYKDNKDNADLAAAAKAHLAKAKERAEKAASKDQPEAKAPKAPKLATPEEEKERAEAIVAFINAVTNVKKLDPKDYSHAYNRSKKYLDFEGGGLLNSAPEGKTSPWDRFKDFPGVKDACKAHRTYVKNKAKEEPAQAIA